MTVRFVVKENRGWRFWVPPGEYSAAEFALLLHERAGLTVDIVEKSVVQLRVVDEASPALERVADELKPGPDPHAVFRAARPLPLGPIDLFVIAVVIVAVLLLLYALTSCDGGNGSLAPATMAGALLSEQRHQGGTGR